MCEIRLSLFRFWHLANEISHWWPSGSGSVVVIIISLFYSCVGVLHWYNTPAWTSGKYICILLHYWLFCYPIIIFMFEILLTIKYVWLQTTQQTVLHNFKIVFFNSTKYKQTMKIFTPILVCKILKIDGQENFKCRMSWYYYFRV